MRFFTGVLASIVVSFSLGFFPSIAKAEQDSCNSDSEIYDARTCFAYVQALEAKHVGAKRDLALARRDASILTSRLKAVEARHTRTSDDLRFDIVSRAKTIQSLETTIALLSEEKETAWGYVNAISKVLAAVIGLSIFGGITGLYLLRKLVPDSRRYAIEARDEKIRELENRLHVETDAKLMALGDANALRLELFHKGVAALRLELSRKNSDLARVKKQYADFRNYVRKEMLRFVAIRETLYRTLSLLQTNGSRLEELSGLTHPHATV